jgi:acyl-CoA reductase-like NAD-dependent aldehyde dehydrogenase
MTVKIPDISSCPWSSSDPKHHFPVKNPATGETLTILQAGNAVTASEAAEAAHRAYQSDWRWRTPGERGALLLKCADELEAHREELAELVCLENGKPKQDALLFDVPFLSEIFRFFGSLVDKLPTEFYDKGSTYCTVIREPLGVCAAIIPFNWPPIHTGGKLAPALAAGNTVVLKPGDQAPLTSMRIVSILQTVLPLNVIQIVPGLGPEVPQALISHPLVKMVSFTGSTKTGSIVSKTAAETLTPTLMELGGKNAFIVFDDADLDAAVSSALDGGFFNKGESCTAASRILAHRTIHDQFVQKLAKGVKNLLVGSGMDPTTHVGPCVSRTQQQRVLEYIRKAEEEGAEIVAQAELPAAAAYKNGFFVPPTLFRGVTRSMEIATEEVFGPVVTVTPFESEEEAVSIANSSAYGLTAIIYTKDMERGLRVSRRIDAGMVWVNNYFRGVLGTPFGGVKDSGYGREHCIETLLAFTSAKTIRVPSGLGKIPQWRAVADIFGNQKT